MFCGWDWGSTIHGVCLLDDDGVTIKTWMLKHTDAELAALFAELAELGDPALIPVAIEREPRRSSVLDIRQHLLRPLADRRGRAQVRDGVRHSLRPRPLGLASSAVAGFLGVK